MTQCRLIRTRKWECTHECAHKKMHGKQRHPHLIVTNVLLLYVSGVDSGASEALFWFVTVSLTHSFTHTRARTHACARMIYECLFLMPQIHFHNILFCPQSPFISTTGHLNTNTHLRPHARAFTCRSHTHANGASEALFWFMTACVSLTHAQIYDRCKSLACTDSSGRRHSETEKGNFIHCRMSEYW